MTVRLSCTKPIVYNLKLGCIKYFIFYKLLLKVSSCNEILYYNISNIYLVIRFRDIIDILIFFHLKKHGLLNIDS